MSTGFQQQQPVRNNGFCKPIPTPQHGRKAEALARAIAEARSFQPRPGVS